MAMRIISSRAPLPPPDDDDDDEAGDSK